MANFNKVILIGNLTRDPEVRYTPKGTAVGDIALAVNRVTGGGDGGERREETTYIDVTLWGRTAELAQQYLSKGRSVMIEGRLQLDSWEDKNTGQKRSKLKVVGENMQFLGGGQQSGGGGNYNRGNSGSDSQGPSGGSPAPSQNQPPSNQSPPNQRGGAASEVEFEDDDIPF